MKKKLNLELLSNTLVDQLVEILQERIISGELPPGTKLSEPGLSQEFGISRVPIREALIILEGEGLITKTYSGREVVRISREVLKELFEIKIALEAYAAHQIAGRMAPAVMNQLNDLIARTAQYLDTNEKEKFRQASTQFHDRIIAATGNTKLTELYTSIVRKIRWTTSISLNLPHRYELTIKEHTKVLDALKTGSREKAMTTILEHSTSSMNRIMDQINELES